MAYLGSIYFNGQTRPGAAQIKIQDLLLFSDPWKDDPLERLSAERYSDLDREIFGQLK